MAGRRYRVTVGGRVVEVEVTALAEGFAVVLEGRRIRADLSPPDASGFRRLRVDDRQFDILLAATPGRCSLALDGISLDLAVEDERAARLAAFGGGQARVASGARVTAPMPGLVVRVPAEEGQRVEAGQVLVVLQAMKMENELGSPGPGAVRRIHVQAGQPVELGQLLVEIE